MRQSLESMKQPAAVLQRQAAQFEDLERSIINDFAVKNAIAFIVSNVVDEEAAAFELLMKTAK